jgi:small subunit ribosomal protein S4
MSGKRLESKHKLSRRIGANLWGQAKSPVNRRNYGPGQHGQKSGKPSGYRIQLTAKQTLKGYYGNIGERQFRRYYDEAVRRRGDTGELLIELLERRLDAVIYRLKFAPTVFAARQLVNHGHVLVNGKRLNIASAQVKDGDVIELRERSRQIPAVIQAVADAREVADYLEVDHGTMKGKFLRTPSLSDVPYPVRMEPNLVVEFYSR